jgi:hemoglobin
MLRLEISDKPFEGGEMDNLPDMAMYDNLGEEGIRHMVSDHYDLLVRSEIKHLFPDEEMELRVAKQNASDFFVQRLGGPSYYLQSRGNPMLARRHMPFKINARGRVVWLECYREVLSEIEIPDHLIQSFWNYIHNFSFRMINTD